ncbi:MAG TPA: hypothetical protein VG147_03380, partial [Solirubrobacteraceae bacterium]|nr:hypothetical protein [Solirubrobacteraceae bacterium]
RALGDLRFQERGEVRSRGLLVACGLLGEPAEAGPDGGEVKLAGVRGASTSSSDEADQPHARNGG